MASRKRQKRGSSRAPEKAPPAPVAKQADAAEIASTTRELTDILTRIGGLAAVDNLLRQARGFRLFGELAALGSALQQSGHELSPVAMKLTAQGLIETGRFKDAKDLLDRIVTGNQDPAEVLEARGLRGRIHKQIYVNEAIR